MTEARSIGKENVKTRKNRKRQDKRKNSYFLKQIDGRRKDKKEMDINKCETVARKKHE